MIRILVVNGSPHENRSCGNVARFIKRFAKGNKASKGFNNWSKERQEKQRKLSREKCLRLINDPDSNFGPHIKSSKPLGKKVICLETKEVFLSAAECARKMNLNVDGLYSSIRRMNKYNGKKYMYLSVYEEIDKRVNDNMSNELKLF